MNLWSTLPDIILMDNAPSILERCKCGVAECGTLSIKICQEVMNNCMRLRIVDSVDHKFMTSKYF